MIQRQNLAAPGDKCRFCTADSQTFSVRTARRWRHKAPSGCDKLAVAARFTNARHICYNYTEKR
jgi:hypothetical protein